MNEIKLLVSLLFIGSCINSIVIFKIFIYFKGKVIEGKAESNPPSAGAFLKWLQKPDLDQAKTRIQDLHPALLLGWQGPKYLVHLLLPSRHISSKNQHSHVGC